MAIAQTRSREIQLFEPAQNALHTRKCRAAPFSKPITVLYVNDDQSNAFDKYKVGTRTCLQGDVLQESAVRAASQNGGARFYFTKYARPMA